jgi:phosphopantothenoylcysteine decarboxylase/phosphopantothenate--cysteine ligase
MKTILVCVSGGIASYKAPNVVSKLIQQGYNVNVAMTHNATKFISPMVFESLTSNKVFSDTFDDALAHINLGKQADVILVVPTTYNIIGKIANGIADDLVSSIISAYNGDIFFALAMNNNMYTNPILLKNIDYLKSLSKYHFINADEGFLACNTNVVGRLKLEIEIVKIITNYLQNQDIPKILQGKKVLITAGKTKEYMDPIRYISNDSTGLMGYSLAKVAKNLGADVTLVIGENYLPIIESIKTINVVSAQQMYDATYSEFTKADIIIFSAAVSDYKFSEVADKKIKKINDAKNITIDMVQNIDIAKEISKNKKNQITVGFALETNDIFDNAIKKLNNKNLDFILANSIENLGSSQGHYFLLNNGDEKLELMGSKEEISQEIFKYITKK